MKLSIITISYNSFARLKKTIESVFAQTFNDFEYIIIDGGSIDGSKTLLEENAGRLAYWTSEPDSSKYNAMNKGIVRASGEYLLFLNSGDFFYDDNVLENIFLKNDIIYENSIFYGQTLIFSDTNNLDFIYNPPNLVTIEWLLKNNLQLSSTIIPKRIFEKYGVYDESYEMISDWTFFVSMFFKPEISFKYLAQPISVTSDLGRKANFTKSIKVESERRRAIKEIVPNFVLLLVERNQLLESYFQKIKLFYFLKIKNVISTLKNLISVYLNSISNPIRSYFNTVSTNLFYKSFQKNNRVFSKTIPIIINNRNRLSFLKLLIKSLVDRGYTNIHIIDNNSTFPPLLEYYKQISFKVYYLDKNVGFCALWDTPIFNNFKDQYYVYTDSDVVISDDCPEDFLCWLQYLLYKYNHIDKVGLGIIFDNLPHYYEFKDEVYKWESTLIKNSKKLEKNVVEAPVDTTFALYRPNKFGPAGFLKAIRTLGNFQIKHMPWYLNSANLSEEEQFYITHAHTVFYTHWTAESKRKLNKA
ncbi:MAG: glycosyltransferase [Sediminibacterium sp.]|nr:glycosyltransferase [Sediminibacterium sp.]